MSENTEVAVFGGGCFWCVEAVFQRVKGVEKVESGYAGGHAGEVSYEQMHKEDTGHAEVVEITFKLAMVTYEQLLDIFWTVHDPTTPNRQGNDVGPQYRSIILTTTEDQKSTAEKSKAEVASQLYEKPIVTDIKPLDKFYTAEEYHQNYYNLNKDRNPYCQVVIDPKLVKFKQKFAHLMKEDS